MALMKAREVPKDAVTMDEMEATRYVWDLVSDWHSSSDVWALEYGPVILGGVNALCGALINRHYRFKLRVGTYGYIASALPITAMPGIMTALFHRQLVSTEVLLMKREGCPICHELRAGAIQLSLGLVYPLVLGSSAALMMAHRYSTYRIPELKQGPKVVLSFLRKITRPYSGTLAFMVAGQLIASSAITYFEMRNHITMNRKIMEIETRLEAKQAQSKS